MANRCPQCNAYISPIVIISCTFGLGANANCSVCGVHITTSETWRTSYAGIAVLSLILAVMLSIMHRSYLPYLIVPFVVAMFSMAVVRYANLIVIAPKSIWLSFSHYITLAVVLAAILYATR